MPVRLHEAALRCWLIARHCRQHSCYVLSMAMAEPSQELMCFAFHDMHACTAPCHAMHSSAVIDAQIMLSHTALQ